MKITNTAIEDVKIIEHNVYEDKRGFFFESFNLKKFEKVIGHSVSFVQENHSKSKKDVIRGLHYQLHPHAQDKLIRVTYGKVFDVAVDLRRSSSTFGYWIGVELSSQKKKQLWIPKGFAHGFLALTEGAELIYKTTDYYMPELERSIPWNDKNINIQWNTVMPPIISSRDHMASELNSSELFD